MSKPVVAVLGIGLMGGPMALNLLKAGFEVHAWNRTRAKADPLAADGATVHDHATDAVVKADFVITMLSDGPAVYDILFNKGVASAMKPGAAVLDMSSTKPAEAKEHAQKLSDMGLGHLDAPVSGGTRGAQEATLAIMAGGDEAVFGEAEEVFKAMGRPVRVGPDGAGQLSKLANQAIVAVTIGVVSEAMLLAEAGGADPAAIREALKGGFADSIILQQHGERMTTGNFKPGGLCRLQLKDVNNVLEEAANCGLKLPLSNYVQERFTRLTEEMGMGEYDHSALYLDLKDINGMEVK